MTERDGSPRGRAGLSTPRLLLLASGDFACNLYWQSVSFFLLFFYTDVVRLSPAQAGWVFAAGSAWDGLAGALVGAWAGRARRYRDLVAWGAAPLGASFVLLYVSPPRSGAALPAVVLLAHLAFRTAYAAVNIPYAALSARVTRDSGERGRLAGLRMLWGVAAALVVAAAARRLLHSSGSPGRTGPHLLAAALFAALGAVVLLVVAVTAPAETAAPPGPAGGGGLAVLASLRALARNRAFLVLNLAAGAATVGGTVLNASVAFVFAHLAHAPALAPVTVMAMSLAGAAAVLVWMRVRDAIGTRGTWTAAAGLGLVAAAVYAAAGGRSALAAQAYFVAMQAAAMGFVFGFWAMLPDTVDWGEQAGGPRVEALSFGVAALVQKVAAGLGAGLLGTLYARAGYQPGRAEPAGAEAAIRFAAVAVPALAIALSAAAMAADPLRPGRRRVSSAAERA